MKTIISILIVFLALAVQAQYLYPNTNPPASVTLTWDPSPDSEVTGYSVYWGGESRGYTNRVDADGTNYVTITNVSWGSLYYFAATAYTAGRQLESGFSEEVSYQFAHFPPAPSMLRVTNPIVRISVLSAPSPVGPWTSFATLSATTSGPSYFRSSVAIAPPPAPISPTIRILSPKAASLRK